MCCDFEHSHSLRITLQYQSNKIVSMLAFSNGSNFTLTNSWNTPKRKKEPRDTHPIPLLIIFDKSLQWVQSALNAKNYMHWAIARLVLASSSARATPIKSQQQEQVSKSNQSICLWSNEPEKQSSNKLRVLCDLIRSVHVDSPSSWMQMGLAGG